MNYQLFFQPPYDIFTIFALFTMGLSLIEIVMFVFGASFTKLIGSDNHIEINDPLDFENDISELSFESDYQPNLFNLGEVPFLVILLSFSSFFSFLGFGSHWLLSSMGINLSNIFVVPMVTAASSGFTYLFTNWWKKTFPNSESYAVSEQSLIGKFGTINLGTANKDNPVEVAIYDEHNSKHYVMAKAASDSHLYEGQKVILVHKEKDGFYLMLPFHHASKNIDKNVAQNAGSVV